VKEFKEVKSDDIGGMEFLAQSAFLLTVWLLREQ
jgi:hypothetical protein